MEQCKPKRSAYLNAMLLTGDSDHLSKTERGKDGSDSAQNDLQGE